MIIIGRRCPLDVNKFSQTIKEIIESMTATTEREKSEMRTGHEQRTLLLFAQPYCWWHIQLTIHSSDWMHNATFDSKCSSLGNRKHNIERLFNEIHVIIMFWLTKKNNIRSNSNQLKRNTSICRIGVRYACVRAYRIFNSAIYNGKWQRQNSL